MADLPINISNPSKFDLFKLIYVGRNLILENFRKISFSFAVADRQRIAKLDLNTNTSNDDMSSERRRQLKLSFQPDSIKTQPVVKSPALPDRTR